MPENFAIHDAVAERWSPSTFDGRAVSDAELRALLEAARLAPSSRNEQPWRFIVASRNDTEGFKRILGCLMESNQAWAADAGALILTVTSTISSVTGKPNRFAWHDVGLAVGNLLAQATSMGLSVHQMGGFSATKAREDFSIPDGFEPVTAIAVGHAADPDEKRRGRKPLSETAFSGSWGTVWQGSRD